MNRDFPAPLAADDARAAWRGAWATFAVPPPPRLLDELETSWSEPNRRYHDLRHLRECLALFSRWQGACEHPGEVALALWFHDAVHDAKSPDNELKSASWAARSLVSAGVAVGAAQRVHDLVIATCHGSQVQGQGRDAELLLDVDLAILGSPPERFTAYDDAIREEYAWVPLVQYRVQRQRVLQGFLARPRIYATKAARELLEAQARLNLAAALRGLAQ
ncbi:HD domain-containing protein [Piscinibacter koreensis]|uniref:N-methyl-D-aspartate receptor NMDAR2C subunit n=1 Tax=Piscinibacter koreensis TaxID=2742824 RepID=A0A7Y6NTJ3_9BURK|nr:N-methyl-D-aspartate receptor NMDAR2C subunit [Schlegelella koreensis]NUZ09087.1 N-methyl-D-aspartate receptor NMDAR2C subunit [Schlegelella koreensis]